MTLSELEAELKRTFRESEDVSRKLEPRQAYSWRKMIKNMLFHRTPDDPGISSLFRSVNSISSRQHSLSQRQIRINSRISSLKKGTKKEAVQKAPSESSPSLIASGNNPQQSKHRVDMGWILSPIAELAPSSSLPNTRANRARVNFEDLDGPLSNGYRKYLAREADYENARSRAEERCDIILSQYDHDEQYLAFHIGSLVVFLAVSRFLHLNSLELLDIPDMLIRPREDYAQQIEGAWNRLLQWCDNTKRKIPDREEFDTGLRSATKTVECVINVFKNAEELYFDRVDMLGFEAVGPNDIMDLTIASAEAKLRVNLTEPQRREPLDIRERDYYQVALLCAQIACYERLAMNLSAEDFLQGTY
jgi:hypothetical protein